MAESKSWTNKLRSLGPGLLVTAAFIGPGTVTTASKAGAETGFSLLWSILFAVLATIVLQEMSARLGLVTRAGLGEAIRETFQNPIGRMLAMLLVVVAIGFGNAAYQTGNLTGAAGGLQMLIPDNGVSVWPVLIALISGILLWTGSYKIIERVLIGLVVTMSLLFLLTVVIVQPDYSQVAWGLLIPTVPDGDFTLLMGLIGTTVVPYNLFLHADSVCAKWSKKEALSEAIQESRIDTCLSISLGGLVTMAIIVTAAMAFPGHAKIERLQEVAAQLEPLLGGELAVWAFALGLFAAGLTSSITAPLASAYAISGIFGWEKSLTSWRFRAVWLTILLCGTSLAIVFSKSPIQTIVVAQVANGLLLPIIAIFLLIVVNRKSLLGNYANGWLANILGICVVIIATAIGLWKILQQFGLI